MAEPKSSTINEVLKREKLSKDFEKEKIETEKKAIEAAVAKMETSSKSSGTVASASSSKRFITAFDIAYSQATKDLRYYFLGEADYGTQFKNLFLENENIFKRHSINGKKYLEYVREAFERYKKIHSLMPMEPMKPKHFKYVEESIQELIRMLSQRFGK
ncbi:LIC11177 family protein [Leptospira idonii]|uniref:Uncharacterized protein n=1 Tax=Leptospira idonii TaxID=1193500 RepID=A0A4R9M1Y9_9LEPT|nr:hypothetical protein [Leptospira idonii]TGN20753.1 hypothetical protein EHS15_02530 [Leptospira idonii]